MSTPTIPRLAVSLTEAAEMLGFSERTIRRAIAETKPSKKLRAAKVRGQWRIRVADLESWLDRHTVGGKR